MTTQPDPLANATLAEMETFAAGLRVPKALGDFLVLEALAETGGTAIAVPLDIGDDESPSAMAKAAVARLEPGSALLTLTYLGALRSIPNYNTMGLAKASLEASVRYLAASLGAKGIRVNVVTPGPVTFPGGNWTKIKDAVANT